MELSSLPRFLKRIKRFSMSCRISTIYFLVFLLLLTDLSPILAATFTAGMAKRDAPGPFTAGILSQGITGNSSSDDFIEIPFIASSQISGQFSKTMDANQGSVVFWITPE